MHTFDLGQSTSVSTLDVMYDLAICCIKQSNFSEAISIYKQIIDQLTQFQVKFIN